SPRYGRIRCRAGEAKRAILSLQRLIVCRVRLRTTADVQLRTVPGAVSLHVESAVEMILAPIPIGARHYGENSPFVVAESSASAQFGAFTYSHSVLVFAGS